MVKTAQERTLDDHSKRIAALEQSQIYFGNEQRETKTTVEEIRDYLFGSSNPNEESAKEQLRWIRKALEKMKEQHAADSADTLVIRKDGFKRLAELETWRDKVEINSQQKHEVKLAGIKMSAEFRQVLIQGLITGGLVLLGVLVK